MSSNIKIVAIEQSQSIQFFNFPAGQGSGGAPNNSIPLVNRKQPILRADLDAKQNDNTVPVPPTIARILFTSNPNPITAAAYSSPNSPITAPPSSPFTPPHTR